MNREIEVKLPEWQQVLRKAVEEYMEEISCNNQEVGRWKRKIKA